MSNCIVFNSQSDWLTNWSDHGLEQNHSNSPPFFARELKFFETTARIQFGCVTPRDRKFTLLKIRVKYIH